MHYKSAFIGTLSAIALLATPVAPASAHGYYHRGGLIFGLAALGAAVVGGAAAIATAPFRAIGAAAYGAPPPAYYYAPVPRYYYAPPPAYYYAPPPAYYSAPGYYGR